MIKALIFDFDGVLVLSEKARFGVLQTMAKRNGLIIKDELLRQISGRTTKDFFQNNFPTLDDNVLRNIIADYTAEYKDKIIDHVTPISFTNDFIKEYSGDKVIAVTSANTTKIIELLLSHLKLRDKISTVVGQEHVTKHKPDPEAYLYTAKQLRIPPEQCTVFEDTAVGVRAALNAGMQVYSVLNGLNLKSDFASLAVSGYVQNYDELMTVSNL